MITNKYVEEYISLWRAGKILLNRERILLIEYLEKHILSRDDLFFDDEKIENFITFAEKYYFELRPDQKFVAAFIFLFETKTQLNYYDEFALFMARGAGKNGFISALSNFLISPLHGIKNYGITIVANSEKQAKTSFNEVYNMIDTNELYKCAAIPDAPFSLSKTEIQDLATKSILSYDTSNAKTKDGGREGCVIFDEVHRYENADMVNVKRSGLGKVLHDRTFYIGTDGFVREGFMDEMKDRITNILQGKEVEERLFPFWCKLDDKDEVNTCSLWQKANPMFSEPMSKYASNLFRKVQLEYKALATNRSNRPEFMTKRMNLPEVDLEKVIAPWEEILATNRPMPDLSYQQCIGGLDFANIRDFASVGLLFRNGEDYIWLSHSFIRKGFLDTVKLEPPIKLWEQDGLLTIVDNDVIEVDYIVNWFIEMREKYGLEKVVADNYRTDIVRRAFDEAGIELEVIRNPKAIHGLLAPRIDTMFAKHNVVYGDNPLMRWFTNNVAVKIKPDGNKEYIKKDEVRRKTDGFMAFVHALYRADDIVDVNIEDSLDMLLGMNF